jgi:hypothetical protein
MVVTHHAPHRGSLAQRYADDWASGAFVTELPDTFFDVTVLWVHGHTHQQFDYRVRSCRVVSNPRGYVNWSGRIENKAFDSRAGYRRTPSRRRLIKLKPVASTRVKNWIVQTSAP